MAEKGFGVKEVNLIGASGTPTITSPNNLNLNANNVAISTNVSIGGTLSVTGNVSVGGTLTYEDVTNIDSVGIVTARAGVVVGDTSNTTFRVHRIQGASATNCGLALNSGGSLDLFTDSSGAGTSRISISNTGNIQFGTLGSTYFLLEDYVTHAGDTNTQYGFDAADSYVVKTGGSTRLTVNNSGANVVGALTVNGSAISIDPTDSDIQVAYTVTANGTSAYRFAGNGVVSTADNPDLYLIRGQKYRFINNSGGSHPFQIREASGGTAYSTGVTNNGAASGNIDFAPTYDSPAQLVYQCTSHGSMVGNIYLRDAAGGNTNVGVTTFANITANNINGTPNINVGTGEANIYSTGSGEQHSLRLLNSDASAGNKIGIYFGPANNVAGAYIKGVAESDFTSAANRDAGLEFGTRLNATFLTPLKISAAGYVTKPLNPVFHVFGGPSNVNTNTDIVFGQQRFAVGGGYNTSTGEYTAPVTGYYHFYAQVYRQTTSSDSWWGFYLDTGGGYNQISESRLETDYGGDSARGYCTLQSSIYYLMTAGHKIKCRVGAAGAIHCNTTLSYFCGNLVG